MPRNTRVMQATQTGSSRPIGPTLRDACLQQDGVRSDQVTQVRAYADQLLRVKNNPFDPSNRRISILVKNQEGTLQNLHGARVVNGPPDALSSEAKASVPDKRRAP